MQKFVIASALLAAAVSADDVTATCSTEKPPTVPQCAGIATVVSLPAGVTWTDPAAPANVAAITYAAPEGKKAACADAKTIIDQACATGIIIGAELTTNQLNCLKPTAKQGSSKSCGIADGGDCSGGLKCANFECNSDFKCAAEPIIAKTLNCISTNTAASQIAAEKCSNEQVEDLKYAPGVTLLKPKTIVTFKYSGTKPKTETCGNIKTFDPTLADCITALTTPAEGEPVNLKDITTEHSCLTPTAHQGIAKDCALSDGADCLQADFCVNFAACSSRGFCEVEPVRVFTEYTWAGIPSFDVSALRAKILESFPVEAAEGNPCAGLGLTFSIDAVYPTAKNAFITASNPIAADCLATVTSIAATTEAQGVCHEIGTCGADGCKCEPGMSCTPKSQTEVGQANCVDGQHCVQQEQNQWICSSSTIASAGLAVAAAVLAVIF